MCMQQGHASIKPIHDWVIVDHDRTAPLRLAELVLRTAFISACTTACRHNVSDTIFASLLASILQGRWCHGEVTCQGCAPYGYFVCSMSPLMARFDQGSWLSAQPLGKPL